VSTPVTGLVPFAVCESAKIKTENTDKMSYLDFERIEAYFLEKISTCWVGAEIFLLIFPKKGISPICSFYIFDPLEES